ncbi:hypothetical protein H9657_13215 [Cellulomonas sp. Sa3CUA2]|uniref:Uncharacterized protein n=1 Tax=Cellulomonas avistercoris TaxID=2762242 RepID=A0ABR8QFP5_9CELL|nr:hypothetical protein [Cellulomonas avistercoris]MBD7919230.1 hypothetical protein [Cellulomonas avistercoris]
MSIVDDAIAQDVRTYAAQVRAALADLGQEQVDDLTDGLEVNLADALADDGRAHRGSLVDEFGTPEAYAAELRSAAGLAAAGRHERTESAFRAMLLAPWREANDVIRTGLARLRGTRWFPGVEDLLVALRPAWWVLRGWALAHLVLQLVGAEPYPFWVPSSSGGWVLMILAVVASAQWGRGEWRAGPRWDRVLEVLSRVLALAALILVLTLPGAQRNDVAMAAAWVDTPAEDGVFVAGEQASNLFVYDADGNPVDGAQVFDQQGRPVTTEPDGGTPWLQQEYWPDGADEPLLHVGVPGSNGQTRWNVFPLHSLSRGSFPDGTPLDVTDERVRRQVVAPSWPFATAAAVVPWQKATDGPQPTPTPSATAPAEDAPAPADEAPAPADEAPAADAPADAGTAPATP